jgi:hypothetical protein
MYSLSRIIIRMRYDEIPTRTIWLRDSAPTAPARPVAAMTHSIHTLAQGNFNAPSAAVIQRPPDLKPIDDLIELYAKAWSAMAKRNVIVDLYRAINTWRLAHNAVPPAIIALDRLVQQLYRTMPSARKYSDVICTGWRTGCNYNANTKLTSPKISDNPDYFRYSETDAIDMGVKCIAMAAAIRAASSSILLNKLTDNAQTLKIFMAPEFYFRGVNGAYSPDLVSRIVPRLVADLGAGWDDWLFVFGTAVAAIEDTVTFCRTCGLGNSKIKFERDVADPRKTKPKCERDLGGAPHLTGSYIYGAEVQNVALIHHAGESHLVAKEYISDKDYKDGRVTVQSGAVPVSRIVLPSQGSSSARSRIKSVFDDERMGGCILNVAGLTIGIEVCLDHTKPGGGGRATPSSGTIQILLIPSYGKSIGDGLYCRAGGVAFNVDGRGLGTSDMRLNGPGVTQRFSSVVPSGRGAIDIWKPVPIPQ